MNSLDLSCIRDMEQELQQHYKDLEYDMSSYHYDLRLAKIRKLEKEIQDAYRDW